MKKILHKCFSFFAEKTEDTSSVFNIKTPPIYFYRYDDYRDIAISAIYDIISRIPQCDGDLEKIKLTYSFRNQDNPEVSVYAIKPLDSDEKTQN